MDDTRESACGSRHLARQHGRWRPSFAAAETYYKFPDRPPTGEVEADSPSEAPPKRAASRSAEVPRAPE